MARASANNWSRVSARDALGGVKSAATTSVSGSAAGQWEVAGASSTAGTVVPPGKSSDTGKSFESAAEKRCSCGYGRTRQALCGWASWGSGWLCSPGSSSGFQGISKPRWYPSGPVR
eukprot:scaffold4882_cov70-Phaeocystis_antarctica.AAC.14